MTTRRAAREQQLPQEEVDFLRSLSGPELDLRSKELYGAGWTLRSIGEALLPVRAPSTVRSWINRKRVYPLLGTITLPVPTPTLRTEKTYTPRRPISPGIPAAIYTQIEDLAPIARKYRAGMDPRHKASQANALLTRICTDLYTSNVPVQELADAAGVTYRAMARRVKG